MYLRWVLFSDDADFWQDCTEGVENSKPVIYFKVVKVLPKIPSVGTLGADKEHTSLFVVSCSFSALIIFFCYNKHLKFCLSYLWCECC